MIIMPSASFRVRRLIAPSAPVPPEPTGGITNPFPTDWSGPVVTLSGGVRTTTYSNTPVANTLYDARLFEAYLQPGPDTNPNRCATIFNTATNVNCMWYGGFCRQNFIHWQNPDDVVYHQYYQSPYDQAWDGVEMGRNTYADTKHKIVAVRTDNAWDSVSPRRSENWLVSGVYATDNHDDFIENDNFAAGTLEDCLVDGTFVFYSARSGGSFGSPEAMLIPAQVGH